MGFLKTVFLISLVSICLFGYLLYLPLPDGIAEPWKSKIIQQQYRASAILSILSHVYGLGNFTSTMRVVSHYILTFGLLSSSNDEMEVTTPVIGGVKTRMYRPKSVAELAPAFIYYHGGGWVVFSPEIYDSSTYEMAKLGKMVVISVDYRLAPEHPFPEPFNDCVAVTTYVLKNGAALGIDSSKIGIGGDSAGGNLAAAVAVKLTEDAYKDLPKVRFQFLIYPVVQAFDFKLPSYIKNDNAVPGVLESKFVPLALLLYLGYDFEQSYDVGMHMSNNEHVPSELMHEYGGLVGRQLLPEKYHQDLQALATPRAGINFNSSVYKILEPYITNPYFAPLAAPKETLSKVPPAFIVSAEYDILRDDCLLYGRRLQELGVRVVSHHLEDGFHPVLLLSPLALLQHTSALNAFKEFAAFANKMFAECVCNRSLLPLCVCVHVYVYVRSFFMQKHVPLNIFHQYRESYWQDLLFLDQKCYYLNIFHSYDLAFTGNKL